MAFYLLHEQDIVDQDGYQFHTMQYVRVFKEINLILTCNKYWRNAKGKYPTHLRIPPFPWALFSKTCMTFKVH